MSDADPATFICQVQVLFRVGGTDYTNLWWDRISRVQNNRSLKSLTHLSATKIIQIPEFPGHTRLIMSNTGRKLFSLLREITQPWIPWVFTPGWVRSLWKWECCRFSFLHGFFNTISSQTKTFVHSAVRSTKQSLLLRQTLRGLNLCQPCTAWRLNQPDR